MPTPFQRFKEDHSSSIAASFEAIPKLSGVSLQKTYYQDGEFQIKRSAWTVTVFGGGWNHSPRAREIDQAMKVAVTEAGIYKKWVDNWNQPASSSFNFGSYIITGTREKYMTVWWITLPNGKKKQLFCTKDMRISPERAEVAFLHYLQNV